METLLKETVEVKMRDLTASVIDLGSPEKRAGTLCFHLFNL